MSNTNLQKYEELDTNNQLTLNNNLNNTTTSKDENENEIQIELKDEDNLNNSNFNNNEESNNNNNKSNLEKSENNNEESNNNNNKSNLEKSENNNEEMCLEVELSLTENDDNKKSKNKKKSKIHLTLNSSDEISSINQKYAKEIEDSQTNLYKSLRYVILALIIVLIIVMIATLTIALIKMKQNKVFHILCFVFDIKNTGTYYPFITNIYAIFIAMAFLLILLIFILKSLIDNNPIILSHFINKISPFLILNFALFSTLFIIGIFMTNNNTNKYVMNIILNCLGILSTGFIVISSKKLKYKSYINIINEYLIFSFLISIYIYMAIFNGVQLISDFYGKKKKKTNVKSFVSVFGNLAYFVFGILLLSVFKDIIFPLFLVIINMGILSNTSTNSQKETFFSVFAIIFTFYSVVLIIFIYKKSIFKMIQNKEDYISVRNNYNMRDTDTSDINRESKSA